MLKIRLLRAKETPFKKVALLYVDPCSIPFLEPKTNIRQIKDRTPEIRQIKGPNTTLQTNQKKKVKFN